MALKFENYRQFFDNSSDPIYWFDQQGQIVYANNAACLQLGYTKPELLRLSVADIDRHVTAEQWPTFFTSICNQDCKHCKSSYIRGDGSDVPVRVAFSPVTQGDDIYVCAFVNIITMDLQAEQQNKQLQFAVENTLDGFFLSKTDGQVLHVNQSACASLGYSYKELVSMHTFDIDTAAVMVGDGKFLVNGVLLDPVRGTFESRHRRKDGSTFPVEVTYHNTAFEGVGYSFSFARDISKRKEMERQQKELRFIVDHASDAVYMYDREGRIHYANDSAVRESGYSPEELFTRTIMDLDSSLSAETWATGWRNALVDQHRTFESVHTRKDGSTYPVEISVILSVFDGVEYVSAFVRNITKRKQRAREAEELRFIVEKSIDQVLIYNRDGKFHYVNDSACKALGYSRDELLEMTVFDIVEGLTREALDRNWEYRRKGEMTVFESLHKTKDGRLIPVESSVNPTTLDGTEYSCAFVRDISERKAAMQQLEILRFAVDNSIVPFYFYDYKANITYANKSACQVTGYTLDEMLKLSVFDVDPNVTPEVWKTMYPNVKAGLVGTIRSTNKRKDGTIYPVDVTPTNMTFGDLEFGVSVNLDVSDRIEAEKAIRESEEKFRLIADTSPVALIIHRVSDGAILYANRTAESLFSRGIEEMSGHPITSLFDNEESRDKFIEVLNSNEQVYGHELMLGNLDSKALWISLNARTIVLHGEKVICSALLDITKAHDLSLQLSYHAAYDSLTGLVNRREFEARLLRVIKSAGSKGTENALCYMDLDKFKAINDTCGHIAGDELLRQLGQMLQLHIRKRDTLARLGGDEFAVLLENCSLLQAKRAATAALEAIQGFRFVWDNKQFSIGVSIGLVPIDRTDKDITEVMRRADTACYQAKENGRNQIHVYHPAEEELGQRHGDMQWVNSITSALEQDRLQLWSQKIVSVRDPAAKREHYELLVRMVDVNGQIVPPGAFLPAAERYNLITRIDRWVLNNTLNWFARHPAKYKKLQMCSVSVSGQSLSSEDFFEEIIASFRNHKLAPEKFCFEVTETAAIANLNSASHFFYALRKLGCKFALDDFGSGISSFIYLKNIPVDFIKIDGVLIKDLHTDPMHLALVKSINEIGHVMGKKTIAKFVENKQILKKLKSLGVDHAQGFGIAKPRLMIDVVADRLESN